VAHALSHSVWIAAALQAWIAPTSSPVEAQATGAVLLATGRALLVWAMAVNPFFSPCVAKPVRIVREGPYRLLPHPAYAGLALAHIGTFLLLAQTWAVYPLIPYLCLLAWRARVESRLLASLYKP
jgi:protein-S-isoprenylcysteine O-methyltransferase Ste14